MTVRAQTIKNVGATEVRNNLGTLLNRVHRGQEQLVVEKLGIPVAAIISIKDYEQYRRLLLQEHHKALGRSLADAAAAQGISEEKLIAEMEEDRQEIHGEIYGATS